MIIADAFFASPIGVLYYHRLLVAESFLASVLLVMQMALFSSMDRQKYDAIQWFWVLMVSVPFLMVAAKFPSVIKAHRQCKELLSTFQYRSIVEDLEALMWSHASWAIRVVSGLLCLWLFLSIIWLLLLPPCGDLATNPHADFEFTLNISAEKGPCVFFECTCTLLIFTNGALVGGSIAVLEVLRRFPRNFAPPMGGGVPPDLLEWLPTCEVGAPGPAPHDSQDKWLGVSCPICLEDFRRGERLRALPCGHGFHVPCCDGWLARASTCPMRCEGDVRQVALRSKRLNERPFPSGPGPRRGSRQSDAAAPPDASPRLDGPATLGRPTEQP